jgi:hypothetical protein
MYNLQVFVVFHNKFYPSIYDNLDDYNKYLTFYGVRNKQELNEDEINIGIKTLYEYELPLYNKDWQKLKYNEGSALWHLYKNKIYEKYDYIGLFQYDISIKSSCFVNIEKQLEEERSLDKNTIFYSSFFCWHFLGGQTTIIKDYPWFEGGLKNYNKYYNTSFTEEDLINAKMIIGNIFIVNSNIFKKMMEWMSQYYIENIPLLMNSNDGHNFNPGHIIEALTGMYLALEVVQGAVYKQLDISDFRDYNSP